MVVIMEFLTALEIIDRRYNKILKFFLGLACVLDILVMVVEFIVNRAVGLIFILPLIYLIPAFRNMGEKHYVKDVMATVGETENTVLLTLPEVIIEKNDIYSRQYEIERKGIFINWDKSSNLFSINCSGIVRIIDKLGVVQVDQKFSQKTIELSIKEQNYLELKKVFEKIAS